MRGLLLIDFGRLRSHPLRVALAAVGVAAGSALLTTLLALQSSVLGSVHKLERLAGTADLHVTSPSGAGLPADAAQWTAALPSANAAAGIVRQSVIVGDEPVLLVGVDGDVLAFDGFAGSIASDSEAPGQAGIVLSNTLADRLGRPQETSVYSDAGGEQRSVVSGTLASIDTVNDGRLVLAPLGLAQALSGRPGVVDELLVDVADGADDADVEAQLRDLLGADIQVDGRDAVEQRAAEPARSYLAQVTPVAAMALLIGGFLVFNTMTMISLDRRRELAIMRALGAKRSRLAVGIAAESLVIGVPGALIGAASGLLLAKLVVGSLPKALTQAVGVEITFSVSPVAPLVAFVLGVLTAIAAAVIPALRASRCQPIEAIRAAAADDSAPKASPRQRLAGLGGAALVAIALIALAQVNSEVVTVLLALLMVGAIVAAYGFAHSIVRTVRWTAHRGGGLGHISGSGLEGDVRRVWATVMAISSSVALGLAVAGTARNQLDLDAKHLQSLRTVDFYVAPLPLDQLSVGPYLPNSVREQIRQLPGVASVSSLTNDFTVYDGRRVLLAGVDSPTASLSYPGFRIAPQAARRQVVDGEGIIVTSQFSTAFGVEEGEMLTMPSSSGPLELPVVAVVTTLSATSSGVVVLSDELLRSVASTSGISEIEVHLSPTADHVAVRAQMEAILDPLPFRAAMGTGEEGYRRVIAGLEGARSLVYAMLLVTSGIAGLAVLNTLAASVIARSREFALLRTIGASVRQLLVIVGVEAGAIGAAATVIGLAFGATLHWSAVRVVGAVSPLPIDFSVVPSAVIGAAIAGMLTTVIGAFIPLWRVQRLDFIEAIAWE